VCVVWVGGARAPTQDPLEVVEWRERRACRCAHIDKHHQEMQAGSKLWRVAIYSVCGVGARGEGADPRSVGCKQVWVC
jgi:hypothetical protein